MGARDVNTVISTLLFQHDLRLVLLAAVICFIASFAGLSLMHHARRMAGLGKLVWLTVAAVAVGFGIWATHFVAMLAFAPGLTPGYDLPLTLASLAVAVAITGSGLWFVSVSTRWFDAALGGAMVGLGITAMHYVGMAALIIGGVITWDAPLVATSGLFGMVFGALAMVVGSRRPTLRNRLWGTALLTLAICSMHFTAMGAAGLQNCWSIVDAGDATSPQLSLAVAFASLLILSFALMGLFLDRRERKRVRTEISRMRGLADAAVEGLMIVDDQTIVTVNNAFLKLSGDGPQDPAGRRLDYYFPSDACMPLGDRPEQPVETELGVKGGTILPVELVARPIDFGGKPHMAIAIRDLSARKQAEQHIRYLAHYDPLTRLPNRASFRRQLETAIAHAARHGQSLAVFCLDLDRFKEVNDLYGHPAGDAMLQRFSAALDAGLEGSQFAGRLGGDEFALVVPELEGPDRAGRAAEALLSTFSVLNARTTDGPLISTSVGIAIFPDDATDAEHLLSSADQALYRAKQEGRGTYRFFEPEMGAEVRDRRQLEHDLRHAVFRSQLSLVYQPQVNIQSGEVTGFEALLRWRHPDRGLVSPAVFIPLAEESGLILSIGAWVLRQACLEAASWTNPLSVAVNVSAVQVHSAQLPEVVADVLMETGLDPNRLEVEITETALIRDMPRALDVLRQIKAQGVRIAMDDFGTGYSSLSNLRAFPFDKIKVDQSFIKAVDSNPQSAAIVRAVFGLGNGLNLPVVAEGVERGEEFDFLKGEQCAEAQGYWLSRPADIGDFRGYTHGALRLLVPGEAGLKRSG